MEFSFHVRLSDVSARGLHCPARTAAALPFFRLDFDGKIIQSELCTAAGDPRWSHKATMEYRLVESTVQDAIATLCLRAAALSVHFVEVGGEREVMVGRCRVDLFSLATGASRLDMDIAGDPGGAPTGRVQFTLEMAQQSVVALQLSNVAVCALPHAAPVKLSYALLSSPTAVVAGAVALAGTEPRWEAQELPRLLVRSTLQRLHGDTLRLTLRDEGAGGAVLATCDLPLHILLTTNVNHAAAFKRNAYADPQHRTNFTALVTGTLSFEDLPIFAQLTSGANTNGAIHGRPLLDACPVPPRLTRLPQRLPTAAAAAPGNAAPPASSSVVVASSTSTPRGDAAGAATRSYTQLRSIGSPGLALGGAAGQPPPPPQQQQQHQHHQQHQQQQSASSVGWPPAHREGDGGVAPPRSPRVHPAPQRFPRSPGTHLVLDDQRGAPSPLASTSDQLLRQHSEAMEAIDQQSRRVVALTEDLAHRAEVEVAEHDRAMRGLDSEEQRLLDELRGVNRRMDELRVHQEEAELRATDGCKVLRAQLAGFADELRELDDLATHLNALLRSVTEHHQADEAVRSRAREQAEQARALLQNDTRHLSEVEQRIATRSPLRFDRDPGGSPSHNRTGAVSPRPQTPPRRGPLHRAHDRSAPVGVEAPSSRGRSPYISPPRSDPAAAEPTSQDVARLVTAVEANDPATFIALLRRVPRAIHGDDNVLHIACAAEAPSVEIVAAIVAARHELVNAVDSATANTPLHYACYARRPSVEVADVLLAAGADVGAFNDDGLTPFHVSVLNTNDHEHRLKRFLLYKGPVSVNAVTARGETPAHLCASSDRHLEALRFLVGHGASTQATALIYDGANVARPMTPHQKAEMYGRAAEEVRRFLQGHDFPHGSSFVDGR